MKKLLLILICLFVFSCKEETYTEKIEKFEDDVTKLEVHKDSVWLEKESKVSPDEWDKVMLVYGYYDDQENCETIREYFEELFLNQNYRCNSVK
tara:strand:- start:122 stop:403 length:282 start_codon:yes stop_codon:yes gene_type:complete